MRTRYEWSIVLNTFALSFSSLGLSAVVGALFRCPRHFDAFGHLFVLSRARSNFKQCRLSPMVDCCTGLRNFSTENTRQSRENVTCEGEITHTANYRPFNEWKIFLFVKQWSASKYEYVYVYAKFSIKENIQYFRDFPLSKRER